MLAAIVKLKKQKQNKPPKLLSFFLPSLVWARHMPIRIILKYSFSYWKVTGLVLVGVMGVKNGKCWDKQKGRRELTFEPLLFDQHCCRWQWTRVLTLTGKWGLWQGRETLNKPLRVRYEQVQETTEHIMGGWPSKRNKAAPKQRCFTWGTLDEEESPSWKEMEEGNGRVQRPWGREECGILQRHRWVWSVWSRVTGERGGRWGPKVVRPFWAGPYRPGNGIWTWMESPHCRALHCH